MTLEILAPLYPWTKSLHVISVFAWMAGLFYLPRLYVYHSQVAPGDARSELFKVMERRLLKAIMNPAMIASYIFGVLVVLTPGVVDWTAGWWHLKMAGIAEGNCSLKRRVKRLALRSVNRSCCDASTEVRPNRVFVTMGKMEIITTT